MWFVLCICICKFYSYFSSHFLNWRKNNICTLIENFVAMYLLVSSQKDLISFDFIYRFRFVKIQWVLTINIRSIFYCLEINLPQYELTNLFRHSHYSISCICPKTRFAYIRSKSLCAEATAGRIAAYSISKTEICMLDIDDLLKRICL